MNVHKLKRLEAKGELSSPFILKNQSGYLVAYLVNGDFHILTGVNTKQIRCFAKLDSALGAASQVTPLDTVYFRQSQIEISPNE